MCVVSMIYDHYNEQWPRRFPVQPGQINPMPWAPPPLVPSKREIDEFRRLLERAREYDKRNNEPDCEMANKKAKLKELAKQLGVDISFVDEVAP